MSSELDKKRMAHILGGGKEKQDQRKNFGWWASPWGDNQTKYSFRNSIIY